MKKKIILQVLCGFIVQLMVSANVVPINLIPIHIISSDKSVESANNNLSDNVNATKVNASCNVVLNFSNMGLKHIGSNFIISMHVKNLTLQNNSITEFEKGAFDGLPSLEYLDASRNHLSLSELFSFGGHFNLKTLILDYNCLHSLCLPKDDVADILVSDLHKRIIRSMRRRFNSNGYHYDELDDDDYDFWNTRTTTTTTTTTTIRTTTKSPESYRRRIKINPSYYFPELEHLSLRKVNADSLSADWSFNFPKLKYLDLSENSFFEPSINVYNTIPSTILQLVMENADLRAIRSQQLKNITILNVNHNNFDKLSNRFCNERALCLQSLHNLQFLSASNCSINIIDRDAFKDVANLLHLDISNNQLVALPSEIFYDILSLMHLDLSKNNLNEIPAFDILKNLSSLKLDNMQNVTIFDSLSSFSLMPNLTVISMRKNKLKFIPQSFLQNLPALQNIDLSYNEITSLPPFPSQIHLNKLFLSFNRVSNIDDLSLNGATALEILDLKNNPIFGLKVASIRMLPLSAFIYL